MPRGYSGAQQTRCCDAENCDAEKILMQEILMQGKRGAGEQRVLVKQRSVRILSKCKRSGVQRDRGQDFVLHTLILRVRRKQRTKNCSFDVAMRRCKKKSGRCQAAECALITEESLFAAFSLLRVASCRGSDVRFFL